MLVLSRVEITGVFEGSNMKNVLIITLLIILILFSVSGFAQDYMKWGIPEKRYTSPWKRKYIRHKAFSKWRPDSSSKFYWSLVV